MYLRSDERGPAMSNRLALRIGVLGGFAVVLFAILFFRLWQLQVLDGEEYLAEAKNNRTRDYRVIAPRGWILDRDGDVLVDNRTSLALQVNPQQAARGPRRAAGRAVPPRRAHPQLAAHGAAHDARRAEDVAAGAPVTLRRDVGYDLVYYLRGEPGRDFPGVEVQRVFVRDYPQRHPAPRTCSATSARSPKKS